MCCMNGNIFSNLDPPRSPVCLLNIYWIMVAQHPGRTWFYIAHFWHVPGLGLAQSRYRQNCLLVAFRIFRKISAALICIFHPVLSLNVSVSVMNVQRYCASRRDLSSILKFSVGKKPLLVNFTNYLGLRKAQHMDWVTDH